MKRFWRWLFELFVPPNDIEWRTIPFSPILYTATFIAAVLIWVFGDYTSFPQEYADIGVHRHLGVATFVWLVLSILAPPMGLSGLWLIRLTTGKMRYRGFWLRLGADLGMCFALFDYLAVRLISGDYHIMPVATLTASAVFTVPLVVRDVRWLLMSERVAGRLFRGEDAGI